MNRIVAVFALLGALSVMSAVYMTSAPRPLAPTLVATAD